MDTTVSGTKYMSDCGVGENEINCQLQEKPSFTHGESGYPCLSTFPSTSFTLFVIIDSFSAMFMNHLSFTRWKC
jgi:hypothetical protein